MNEPKRLTLSFHFRDVEDEAAAVRELDQVAERAREERATLGGATSYQPYRTCRMNAARAARRTVALNPEDGDERRGRAPAVC